MKWSPETIAKWHKSKDEAKAKLKSAVEMTVREILDARNERIAKQKASRGK